MIKAKTSDLVGCYRELLNGMPIEALYQKYNTIDVWAAIELKEKGITLEELQDFIKRRNEHIKKMLGEKEELWLAVRE